MLQMLIFTFICIYLKRMFDQLCFLNSIYLIDCSNFSIQNFFKCYKQVLPNLYSIKSGKTIKFNFHELLYYIKLNALEINLVGHCQNKNIYMLLVHCQYFGNPAKVKHYRYIFFNMLWMISFYTG